jgi:hypothetical protein
MLLSAAEAAGFEVIVTVDQEIQYQQNMEARRIGVLFCALRRIDFVTCKSWFRQLGRFSMPFGRAKS